MKVRDLARAAFFCAALIFILQQPLMAQRDRLDPAALKKSSLREDNSLVVNTDLVTLTVSVTDSQGRHISGLDRGAFTILDDQVPQEVSFFSGNDAPVSIGVIFDVSGSMTDGKIAQAREALARFAQTSHREDEYFLIAFNSSAEVLLEKERSIEAVLQRLATIKPQRDTALYDAVSLGVEEVLRGTHPRRALLVISDGEDNRSRITFNGLRRRLREADVTIYGIHIGLSLPRSIGPMVMSQLASASGGKVFFPQRANEMDEAFEQIALELRHQYSIGYVPSNFTGDGRWHRVKIKVTPPSGSPRLAVRSREGYYATAIRASRETEF